MKIDSKVLLVELSQLTKQAIQTVKEFQALPADVLNFKPDANTWSILECIEHLNRYGDFYLPEVEKQMLKTGAHKAIDRFKSGLLGNYFVEMIKPKEKLNKIKALDEMNPNNSELDATSLDRFIKQLNRWLQLFERAETINLTKVKTAISFTKLIRLRLGDTLRFVVHHNERHLVQAKNLLENQDIQAKSPKAI